MVRLKVAVLLAVAAVVRAVTPAATPDDAPVIVPGAYIVEYEEDQDSNAFVNTLGGEASLRKDLRFKLFKGASIQFKDTERAEEMVAKVAEMPEIKRVYPVRRFPIPRHIVHTKGAGVQAMLAKRQQDSDKDTFSPHLMTQVNQFRDAGITGKGIKIAVVDTGIDYKHPALGGCFGPGCLVSYGTDLVGDGFNGANTPQPDDDPFDSCQGHGTHVAGIIAAQSNNPYGIHGAAQDVTLGAYRVFGCSGDVGNDILIAAFNMAYEDGSDIISASIGGPAGWAEEPWAAVVSRIVENGVPCVISAGNSGSAGTFYASTAANGERVAAIASVDNIMSPKVLANASFSVDGGSSESFGFTAGEPAGWNNVTLPLWTLNFNTTDPAAGCTDADWASAPADLTGHIVLIRRGTCYFTEKARRAADRGARYVIFYNTDGDEITSPSTVTPGIVASAMVLAEQGAAWIKALEAGSEIVVTMPDPGRAPQFIFTEPNRATGGFVSDYTTWGPTFELQVKPQFSSPGGLILSTYPTAFGSYAVVSGTSMSCPLVAGVYALLMSVRGTKDPRELENVLSATAHPNLFQRGGQTIPLLAPVIQQGAGLIQAWDAAHATTLLSVSSLSFNDTDHFNGVQKFDIQNTGDEEITYSISNVGAATAYTFGNGASRTPSELLDMELTDDFADIRFDPSKFSIPPGGSETVQVTAYPPEGVNARRLPVYSGYIAINGSDGSALSLPYMGVAGSMHSAVVLERSAANLVRERDGWLDPVFSGATLFLAPPGHADDPRYYNDSDRLELWVNLAMGSALLHADIVPVGGDEPVGQPAGFPAEWNPRGRLEYRWDGRMNNGAYAPEGDYKFVVRGLRIFGDPSKDSEYDISETVPFRLRYLPETAERRATKTVQQYHRARDFKEEGAKL
ncbi:hypothetical protein VTK26DRAFT_881 [Humicola hyalothermophila]